tara:strand:- start:46 stop:411 length:366 start_codon:yes stop_codon:yes gene_type:complete
MKHKSITLSVNVEDIRTMCSNMLSSILSRHQTKCNEHLENLNEAMQNGTQAQILESLRSWLSTHDEAGKEIQNLGELLEILDLGRAQTEVLEDLPNLKEDSLGVGSRSEEPVHIAPDHSQE